jgi:hypothetical protein
MSEAPEILELRRLMSDLPDFLSYEQLWIFREKVGKLMLPANSETRPKIKDVYYDFTKLLKTRAKELGKVEEFARADKLAQLLLETAGLRADVGAVAEDGVKVMEILNDPSRQKEVTAMQSLLEAQGHPADYLTRRKDSVKANYRVVMSRRTGATIRLRDILLAWFERFRDSRNHDKK